jgi:hypothetical protein
VVREQVLALNDLGPLSFTVSEVDLRAFFQMKRTLVHTFVHCEFDQRRARVAIDRMTAWIDQLMSLLGKARSSQDRSAVSTRPRRHTISADAVAVPRPSLSPEIDTRPNEATAPARFRAGLRSEGTQKGKSPSPLTDALFGPGTPRLCLDGTSERI